MSNSGNNHEEKTEIVSNEKKKKAEITSYIGKNDEKNKTKIEIVSCGNNNRKKKTEK